MVKEPPNDGGIEEILSALERASDVIQSDKSQVDADLSGIEEAKGYETYSKDSKGHSKYLSDCLADTARAQHESDKITQETKKQILILLKWPFIFIVGLLVLLIALNMLTLVIAGGKILYLSWGVNPAEVYKALLEFSNKPIFLAPLVAVVVAVAAWLFKKKDLNRNRITVRVAP